MSQRFGGSANRRRVIKVSKSTGRHVPYCSLPITLMLLVGLLLSLLPACNTTITPRPPVFLKIEGSTSMKPLLVELTTAYHQQHPRVTFDIQGGGSALGQTAVQSGRADIGMVAGLSPNLATNVRLTPIAHDAVAIILNRQNRVTGLSLSELRDIFSGRLLNWQDVAGASLPVQVVSREEGSGTRAIFETAVMEDQAVTPTAIVLPNSQAVVEFVAQNPDAVGYVAFTFINDGVYAVPIEGVAPTRENLASGSYFLTRQLALVASKQSRSEVEQLIEFVLSPTGQAIVEKGWGRVR